MKRLFYIAAAAMAVFSACTKEDPIVEVGTEPESVNAPVFKASIEGPATKTELEGAKVNWENGDEVKMIFINITDPESASMPVYTVTPGLDATTATLSIKDGEDYDETCNLLVTAVYPASSFTTTGYSFPATQTYAGDDKIPYAPMVFLNENLLTEPIPANLQFKNATSLLKITVPYSQMHSVSSITVSSNLVMNGPVQYDAEGYFHISAKDCEPVSDENSKLTLNCGNVEIPVDGSRTFYISILPLSSNTTYDVQAQSYEYLQIDVTDGTSTKSMRTNNPSGIQVERNKIYPITFAENYSPAPIYEYVDLGLSVKWATMNVGATKPEEYGDYFAWGATEPYYESGYALENPQAHWKTGKEAGYTLYNAPFQTQNVTNDSYAKWTKYLGNEADRDYKDPSATSENIQKTVLDPEDDAAHVNWGGTWRMPTKAEMDELVNAENCTWTWYAADNTEFNGVAGYKIQSIKAGYTDKWIFLPAAGDYWYGELCAPNSEGYYWSSSLDIDTNPGYGAVIKFSGRGGYRVFLFLRYYGFTIRPVCE